MGGLLECSIQQTEIKLERIKVQPNLCLLCTMLTPNPFLLQSRVKEEESPSVSDRKPQVKDEKPPDTFDTAEEYEQKLFSQISGALIVVAQEQFCFALYERRD